MEYAVKTLQQAIQHFADFGNCRKFMEFMRWPDGVIKCPSCGATKLTWLAKEKVYFCYGDHKRKKFSLKVNTVFEDSPIGLDKWLPIMWMMVNCKNGISSYEVARHIGITQKSAWFMLHRIRMSLKDDCQVKIDGDGGPIEIDETFIGGKYQNMHRSRRMGLPNGMKADRGKAVVMGMLERDVRKVRAKVIPDVTRETLQNEILNQIEKKSTVYTDGATGYDRLKINDFVHETVTHVEEYVRGQVHTQGIENFWSLLKRGLGGTYISVEPFHLFRYIEEQAFRYNNRKLTDEQRFDIATRGMVGKRLTLAELTGKVGETAF